MTPKTVNREIFPEISNKNKQKNRKQQTYKLDSIAVQKSARTLFRTLPLLLRNRRNLRHALIIMRSVIEWSHR